MTFGKPKLTTDPVRCLNCGDQYPEKAIELRHAGRSRHGDYWNSRCPTCREYNGMQEEYAQLSDDEFREKQHEVARLRREVNEQQPKVK